MIGWIQLLVLTFLLLPYVNRVTGPIIERFLVLVRIPLRVTLAILTFLFYEAIVEMMRHQDAAEKDGGHHARMEAMKAKFRSERNFYLLGFTFTVFIIILRLDVILNNYRQSKKRVVELEEQLNLNKSPLQKKND